MGHACAPKRLFELTYSPNYPLVGKNFSEAKHSGVQARLRAGVLHRVTRSPYLRIIFEARWNLTTRRRINKMSYLGLFWI